MSRKPTLYLLSPQIPPAVTGMADHTALLAAEISREGTCEIKVLTAADPAPAMLGFAAERVFDTASPRSVSAVIGLVERDQPDWLIVQFNPFGYGGLYGFNPCLIAAVWRMGRRRGRTKLGLIVHESFVTARCWRSALLSAVLKAQLWLLCQRCDVIFAATDPWTRELRNWFPRKRIEHLPVGSNIPLTHASKAEVRCRLHIAEGTAVLGYFGRVRGSRSVQTRDLRHLSATVERAQAAGIKVLILYLGLDPEGAKALLGHLPLLALGPLTAAEVSGFLAVVDVYLLPIIDGISTRRGSLMCAMQHGLPVVGTTGPDTDQMLREKDRAAFLLVAEQDAAGFAAATLRVIQDQELQRELSAQAQALFLQRFTWPHIGAKLLATLAALS